MNLRMNRDKGELNASRFVLTLLCSILTLSGSIWSHHWSNSFMRHNDVNHREDYSDSKRPLGLPHKKNLVHGYLDDGSGLAEYREAIGETSLLGIPGSDTILGDIVRRFWRFPDFVSYINVLRVQHERRFGKGTQVEAVTAYPIQSKP